MPIDQLPAPYNHALFPSLSQKENINLNNYLSRLEKSDQAIATLEQRLLKREKPTLFVHFGDHQPSFDGVMMRLEEHTPTNLKVVGHSLTYYMIKTNFPVTEHYDYAALDIAYLGSLVLDVAGLPKDNYFTANSILRERCLGHYLECSDQAALASYLDLIFNRLHILKN